MIRQVILLIVLACYMGTSLGSVDRVIDRMMQRMFIDSLKMSKSISNVPLPRGFWATNRVANYPSYYFTDSRNRWPSFYAKPLPSRYVPFNGYKGPHGSSSNIYAPRYTINKSIHVPSMARLPITPPMAYAYTPSFVPQMPPMSMVRYHAPSFNRQVTGGPFMQFNIKVKKPTNKRSSRNYSRRVNLTANIEKESVGEVVASWNTEMKEISISGSKNETKIKSFHNSGNIHSHLGSGVEGSTLISKIARGDKRRVQQVPHSDLSQDKKIEFNKTPEKSGESTDDVVNRDALRYSLDSAKFNQDSSFSSTVAPVINFVPRQGKKFTHISN